MVNIRSLLGLVPLLGSVMAGLLPRQATTAQVARIDRANIEGLGVRSNGDILVTRLDVGEVWQIEAATKKASKLVTIPGGVTATAGIVEMEPDVWYVVGGKNTAGSWGVFRIDLNKSPVAATALAVVAQSKLWNGLSRGWDNDTLLIGDAQAGSVFKMSISTGQASAVITADPAMTPGSGIPFGIDGIRWFNGSLYFTNISKNTFHKVAIDASGKAGKPVSIYSGTPGDDLSFDAMGNAYIATNIQNSVIKVDQAGKITKIATVQGCSCTVFGRTEAAKNTLYVGGGTQVVSLTVPA